MRQEIIRYFTDKEEKFADLLIAVGTNKNVAKVLVFFASNPEATSREIERGADMRQPEVSMAMKYLKERGWIKISERSVETKGRPMKIYEMVKSIREIMDVIDTEKKKEAKEQIAIVKKIKDYVG